MVSEGVLVLLYQYFCNYYKIVTQVEIKIYRYII